MTQTALLVGLAAALSLIVMDLALSTVIPSSRPLRPGFTVLLQVKLFLSTFTISLLAILLGNYVNMYRAMPNPFTRSLIVFTVLLGFYALSSNPVLPLLFGFRVIEIGPFTYLPNLFTSAAAIILLSHSLK